MIKQNRKKLLVLGKSGFIGKSLMEYFHSQNDYEIDGVDHNELELLDEKAVSCFFSDNYFDVVFYAVHWYQERGKKGEENKELDYNLRMFFNVSRCSKSFGKLVFFGSGAEYDKSRDICSVSELEWGLRIPKNDYGFAKYSIGKYIETSDNMYNLRIFGLYGQYEDYTKKFITGCCAKAVIGLPISIRKNVIFDYLYIDDFCKMIKRFIDLECPQYHSYNIASGRKIELYELATIVSEQFERSISIFVCEEGYGREYTANIDRIQKEINYTEFESYDDTIDYLVGKFKRIKSTIDVKALLYQ